MKLVFCFFAALFIAATNAKVDNDRVAASFNQQGFGKLRKVINWLYLEKDEDADKMREEPERLDKFIDFVISHEELCTPKAKDIYNADCKALRLEIDSNREEAGTEGLDISLHERMNSAKAKMDRLFGSRTSDTIRPYGLLTLVDWTLEIRTNNPTRHSGIPIPDLARRAKMLGTLTAEDVKAVLEEKTELIRSTLKFLARNMRTIWEKIRIQDEKARVEELATFLYENQSQMGFIEEASLSSWRGIVRLLGANYYLFATKMTPLW